MTVILGLSGGIGSGKSTVGAALASRLNGVRRSFGDAVREAARERSLPVNRGSLQDLGEALIAQEGWAAFTRRALGSQAPVVILDGVRHEGAVEALAALAADEFHLVFIDCPDPLRAERVALRDGMDEATIAGSFKHANEKELLAVRERADVVVLNDGSQSPEDLVEYICLALGF